MPDVPFPFARRPAGGRLTAKAALLAALGALCVTAAAFAEGPAVTSPAPASAASPAAAVSPGASQAAPPQAGPSEAAGGPAVDAQVQSLKSDVLDLNRDLFVLEQELLYPANTQVAVFVSMDAGTFFNLDTVQLKIDGKEVANYLYTPREVHALVQGGVQRLYVGNLKVGKHELVAFFTGKGPHERDYTRGASLDFQKDIGAKYLELTITDDQSKLQPEFRIKNWD